jgi:myo-inositol 2-dehydrogenase/D-chiro-inositol 1-dehydrogenase
MPNTLNLGLIGAGRIGQVHAATVAHRVPGARLMMVADVNEQAANDCAQMNNVPRATGDPAGVINAPDIDAVLICASTDTHAALIEQAAHAGKHIFCEKPIALELDAIDRALDAVERAGVTLQIGFNRRFDANYKRVRDAIVSGEIGEPHLLHITSRDPAPPPLNYVRVSGGLFLDMTIHDFDMARFLIGSEIVEVHAAASVRVDPEIGSAGDVDTAIVLLKFANGVIGTIDNCRQAPYGYDQRCEVLGSKGAIYTLNNHPNTAVISTAESVHVDNPHRFFMTRYVESYQSEIQAFVRSVIDGTPAAVTGFDGRQAVVIGMAAKQSLREGRPVSVMRET